MAVKEDRVLRPEQAAALLGVSRRWLMREGVPKYKIPFHRPPGSNRTLFLESDLWAVLEAWRQDKGVGSPPRKLAKRTRS
jgi:predicted DNA-binding transcriptional regulator AlpA